MSARQLPPAERNAQRETDLLMWFKGEHDRAVDVFKPYMDLRDE
jgi:hypothetical protein